MAEQEELPQLSLAVENVGHDQFLHDGLSLLLHEYNLLGEVVPEIYALVPDLGRWRLVLTGDIAATVDAIEGRNEGDSYTTNRGSGHVGGVTLPRDDGTFDIVIGADMLVSPPGDHDDLDGLVSNAIKTGKHLARHEAGHVVLQLRGEADRDYREHVKLEGSAAGWTDVVAAYIDDFRIERHTRSVSPPVFSHLEAVGDAITHLSSELTEAKASWPEDLDGAARRSDIAVSGFIRVIAYLASELGVDENGMPISPVTVPKKWERYLGSAWPIWSGIFHKLLPADAPMEREKIVEVLVELCDFASKWSSAIGYERGITGDGRMYAFWTEELY